MRHLLHPLPPTLCSETPGLPAESDGDVDGVDEGLRCQLDVTPEHPQGRLGRDRIKAHIHQLGAQGGGGSAEGPPHRADAPPTVPPTQGQGSLILVAGVGRG